MPMLNLDSAGAYSHSAVPHKVQFVPPPANKLSPPTSPVSWSYVSGSVSPAVMPIRAPFFPQPLPVHDEHKMKKPNSLPFPAIPTEAALAMAVSTNSFSSPMSATTPISVPEQMPAGVSMDVSATIPASMPISAPMLMAHSKPVSASGPFSARVPGVAVSTAMPAATQMLDATPMSGLTSTSTTPACSRPLTTMEQYGMRDHYWSTVLNPPERTEAPLPPFSEIVDPGSLTNLSQFVYYNSANGLEVGVHNRRPEVSIGKPVRYPCKVPGCDQTFGHRSSRSRHQKKFHSKPKEKGNNSYGAVAVPRIEPEDAFARAEEIIARVRAKIIPT